MKDRLNNISKYSTLIVKRFLGLLSNEEKELCDSLLEEKDIFVNVDELKDEKFIISRLTKSMDFGEHKAFEIFEKEIKRRRKLKIYRFVGVASVFLLLLMITSIGFWVIDDKASSFNNKLSENIVPGKNKATITLADGKAIDLDKDSKNILNQGGASLFVDSGKIEYKAIYEYISADNTSLHAKEDLIYNSVEVPRGAEFFLSLADGTRVWVNSESKLKYPVRFTGNTREVFVSGEAYFEVYKDINKPFIIHTSKGKVKVLGTSFNVRDYVDEDELKTTLVTGSVLLISKKGRNKLVLEPLEQGSISEEGIITKDKVDVELFTAWKDGRFFFNKQRLEYIMDVLSRWYDIDVFYQNEAQKDIIFSGHIKRYEDFSKILEMLDLAGDTAFDINKKTVIVREKNKIK